MAIHLMNVRGLILGIFLVLIWQGPSRGEEPLRTAGDRPVDILNLRLDLEVFMEEKKITGKAIIDFEPLRPVRTLRLNAVDHEVSAVHTGKLNEELQFENTGEELIIDFPEPLAPGQRKQVVVDYQVREPKSGLHFFGPTKAEPKIPLMVWSQGEPISNRYWFPCIDHPNERQTTELLVTVPAKFEVLSNGRLISKRTAADGRVLFHWKQEQPHVAYLVTLVVGSFTIERDSWRNLPVLYYVPPNRAADIVRTFGRTREMLEFFSHRFGIDYPWPKYAQVVVERFTAGGMENTSATTLYDQVMHDERAMLDSTPDRLIAHELAHQWWGDLVTCKDWAHLWLNEGFATYSEALWAEHALGRDEFEYLMVQKARAARSGTAKERPIVDRHYPSSRSMFDSRAYPKGAWVLHMLRRLVGDEVFFASLKRYGTEFRMRTVETSDLRQVFERESGRSLERFFYDWTARPGHPVLDVSSSYEAEEGLVRISIEQKQKSSAFHLPLRIELDIGSTEPVVLDRQITEKEVVLYMPVPNKPLAVRVDPELALLAQIEEHKSRDWWKRQVSEDPSVALRIRAVEHLGESKKANDRELLIEVLAKDSFYGVRVEAARALAKSGGDVSRNALISGLEAENPKVRRACAEALSKFPGDAAVTNALKGKITAGDESYFVEAAVLESVAKVEPKLPIQILTSSLEKDSHGEVIRRGALRGLARSNDRAALDLLMEWTRRDKSRSCRITAMKELATWLNRNQVPDHRRRKAAEILLGFLHGDDPRIRRAAVEALRDLGRAAEPAREILESLAEQDPDQRVRDRAQAALESLSSDSPSASEIRRLREELDRLRDTTREIQDRLLKVESK